MNQRFLTFGSPKDVITEVNHLRKGYAQSGNWSLPQICWHLNFASSRNMEPPPYLDVPKRPETAEALQRVLKAGRIPAGVQGPERAMPPTDISESIFDDFFSTMTRLDTFTGPFRPHPMFGEMSLADGKRVHLIHCAHHLGFLSPTAN
jgi:hypothetical protein